MATKRIYYTEDETKSSGCELQIYPNEQDELYINLESDEEHLGSKWIALPEKDAIEIITRLAYYYDLIDDSPELEGKYMWTGDLPIGK